MKKNYVFDFDFTITNFDSTEFALSFIEFSIIKENLRFYIGRKKIIYLRILSILKKPSYKQYKLNYYLNKIDKNELNKLIKNMSLLDWNYKIISQIKLLISTNQNVFIISNGNEFLIKKLIKYKIPDFELNKIIAFNNTNREIKSKKHLFVNEPRIIISDNREDWDENKWEEINKISIKYYKL